MKKREEAAVCQRPQALVKAARRAAPQGLTYDRYVVTKSCVMPLALAICDPENVQAYSCDIP
jgi:hypothetical protein